MKSKRVHGPYALKDAIKSIAGICLIALAVCSCDISVTSPTVPSSPAKKTWTAAEVFGTITITPSSNGFTLKFTRNTSLTGSYYASVGLSGGTFTKKYDVADGASEITASDLTASTGYMLDLTYTGSDFALDSGMREFTTAAAVPIDYFGTVYASDVSYDSFTVNFIKNQPVYGTYSVYYRLSGATTPWTVISLTPGVSKYTILRLEDDTTYEYCVHFQVNDTNETSSVATQLTTHLFKAPAAPELTLKKSNIKADGVTITGIPPTKDYEGVTYITDDPITYRLYEGTDGTKVIATKSTPDFTVSLADYPQMSRYSHAFRVVPVRNLSEGKATVYWAQVPFANKTDKYLFMLNTMIDGIQDADSNKQLDSYSVAQKEYCLKLLDDALAMKEDFWSMTTHAYKTEDEIQAIVNAGFKTTGKSFDAGFSDAIKALLPLDRVYDQYAIWVNDLSSSITTEMVNHYTNVTVTD